MEVRGFMAWLLWLFIHIFYLIGFRNKILVLISWFGDYILFERSGRMIIPKCGDNKL
jgi:NADH dehydrogenase